MITNGCPTKTRTLSADDSMDEMGTDEPGSPYTSLSGNDRKRRRGVIEKRRRDRINCSLADLKRLVPDSNHKPGSSKLEKAEILQLTVDFLQRLHKEGYVLASEARALELRRYGFRDCLMEVQRLLSTFEGVPISGDDLRRHLLAHLQQSERQRDTEAKSYLAQVAAVTNAMLSQTTPIPDANVDLTNSVPQTRSSRTSKHSACGSKSHSNVVRAKQTTAPDTISTNVVSENVSVADDHNYLQDQSESSTFGSSNYYPCQPTDHHLVQANQIHRLSSTQCNQSYAVNAGVTLDAASYPHTLSPPAPCISGNSCYTYGFNPASSYTLSSTVLPCSATTATTTTSITNNNTFTSNNNSSSTTTPNNIGTTITNITNSITTDVTNLNGTATTLGQNESQSTSSPPFHSTPEDSDLGSSPIIKTTNIMMSNSSDLFGGSTHSNPTDLSKFEPQNQKSYYYATATPLQPDQMSFNQIEPSNHHAYSVEYSLTKLEADSNSYIPRRNLSGHFLHTNNFDQSSMKIDNLSSTTSNLQYQQLAQRYPYYDLHSNRPTSDNLSTMDPRWSATWKSKSSHMGSSNYPDYAYWSYSNSTNEMPRPS